MLLPKAKAKIRPTDFYLGARRSARDRTLTGWSPRGCRTCRRWSRATPSRRPRGEAVLFSPLPPTCVLALSCRAGRSERSPRRSCSSRAASGRPRSSQGAAEGLHVAERASRSIATAGPRSCSSPRTSSRPRFGASTSTPPGSMTDPSLRQGFTRREWATGEIPVVPYPAAGIRQLTIDWSYRDDVALDIVLVATAESGLSPKSFMIELKRSGAPAHRHWLVASWVPHGVSEASMLADAAKNQEPIPPGDVALEPLAAPAGLLPARRAASCCPSSWACASACTEPAPSADIAAPPASRHRHLYWPRHGAQDPSGDREARPRRA